MAKKTSRQLSFCFDDETATQLRALAEKEGLAMSAWMRMFIRREYREYEQQQASS